MKRPRNLGFLCDERLIIHLDRYDVSHARSTHLVIVSDRHMATERSLMVQTMRKEPLHAT